MQLTLNLQKLEILQDKDALILANLYGSLGILERETFKSILSNAENS